MCATNCRWRPVLGPAQIVASFPPALYPSTDATPSNTSLFTKTQKHQNSLGTPRVFTCLTPRVAISGSPANRVTRVSDLPSQLLHRTYLSCTHVASLFVVTLIRERLIERHIHRISRARVGQIRATRLIPRLCSFFPRGGEGSFHLSRSADQTPSSCLLSLSRHLFKKNPKNTTQTQQYPRRRPSPRRFRRTATTRLSLT